MKTINKCLIIVLCLTMISCSKAKTPLTGEWSESRNGLQVALRVPSSQMKIREPVRVYVVFRNISDKPCKLPARPCYTVNQYHNGRPLADAIGSAKISKDEPLLQPGEERAFKLQSVHTDVGGPGVYLLKGGIDGFNFSDTEFEVR